MDMSGLNPLLIPEITAHILGFLDIPELLKCRNVCSLWNAEASTFIGDKRLICISDVAQLQELRDLIAKNPDQPFRSFELWSFKIDLDDVKLSNLFSMCGPYFHHLILNFEKDSEGLLNIRGLRDLLLFHFPNLKTLTVRQLPTEILKHREIFPEQVQYKLRQPPLSSLQQLSIFSDPELNVDFLVNLLSSARNVQRIRVEYGDEPNGFKTAFCSALWSCSHLLKNLETLQYFLHDPGAGQNWAWSEDDCENLGRSGFPLKSIKLHPKALRPTSSETTIVCSLLKKLENLEVLKLRIHDELRCPTMQKLTTVILFDYEGSLTFVTQLPNLRHLGLCEYSPAKYLTHDNIVPKKPHFEMASLNFYGSYAISNHIFEAIAKAFPNLRFLNLWHINNEKLKIVIDNFPALEELTTSVVNVDDSALTGFPVDLCEQIERQCSYETYFKDQDSFRTGVHIGTLKHLRRLELHGACLADWLWSSVSDVGIYFGLMSLNSLTSLSLYEFKWVTETAVKRLCEKIPLIYLKLDSRVFPEGFFDEIKKACPTVRIESVTDELDMHNHYAISF